MLQDSAAARAVMMMTIFGMRNVEGGTTATTEGIIMTGTIIMETKSIMRSMKDTVNMEGMVVATGIMAEVAVEATVENNPSELRNPRTNAERIFGHYAVDRVVLQLFRESHWVCIHFFGRGIIQSSHVGVSCQYLVK